MTTQSDSRDCYLGDAMNRKTMSQLISYLADRMLVSKYFDY